MPMTDTMELSFITVTNSLPRAGSMFFTAWGSTTMVMVWDCRKPRLLAASVWP